MKTITIKLPKLPCPENTNFRTFAKQAVDVLRDSVPAPMHDAVLLEMLKRETNINPNMSVNELIELLESDLD